MLSNGGEGEGIITVATIRRNRFNQEKQYRLVQKSKPLTTTLYISATLNQIDSSIRRNSGYRFCCRLLNVALGIFVIVKTLHAPVGLHA